MSHNLKMSAAIVGSFVLGAGAIQALHAQAKPPSYVVAMINAKDAEGYKNNFLKDAQKRIAIHSLLTRVSNPARGFMVAAFKGTTAVVTGLQGG